VASALTQERLAERAGVSAAGIAALESGRRRAPRLSTVSLLIEALAPEPDDRALLLAAAGASNNTTPGGELTAAPEARATDHRRSFVGRAAELEALRRALDERVRVVLVGGEAGIGKSRLVSEVAAESDQRSGVNVLWGRCSAEQLGAYEPFVEPVRAALEIHVRESAPDRRELVRLLPELASPEHGSSVPTRADPGVERRLMFDAVVGVLADAGRTVLVIDDVHWADGASLALLAHLAASSQLSELTIVGTVRSTDATAATSGALADLRRLGSFLRLDLSGLPIDDLTQLVDLVAGATAPPGLLDAVADATDGNPLFAEELTEHLLASGFSGALDIETIGVPQNVRDTLGRRLAVLSTDTQRFLRCGAVLGREFDVSLAGALSELGEADVLNAIEDALLSGLVIEISARGLSFAHALIRTAVYDSLAAARRLDLHRRAALTLEDARPTTSAEIAQLARHWSEVAASDPRATTDAARWAVRAGDTAVAAAAIDDAIDCYQRAAALWAASTVEHTDTLIRLGTAMSSTGRRTDADVALRQALRFADGLGDDALFARAAIAFASDVRYGHSDPERIDALERAVARLGPEESVLRPAALVTLKRQFGYDPSAQAWERRQIAAAQVADALARPDVSDPTLVAVGSLRDSIPVEEPRALQDLSARIIAAAAPSRDLRVLANAWYGAAWAALELNDADRWREAVAAYTVVAEQLRSPFELALAATMAATAAQLTGDYASAEQASEIAHTHAASGGHDNGQAVQLANSVLCGLDRGQASVMLELMLAVEADYVGVPTFLAGLTLTAAAAGDHALAIDLLDRQGVEGFRDIRRDAEWLPVIGFLSHACAMARSTRHAPVLRELLESSTATGVRIGPVAAWWGPIDHHLGALRHLEGSLDAAQRHLEAALATEVALGALPFLARSAWTLADVLDARGDRTDVARIGVLRDEAQATAQRLGAPGLLVTGPSRPETMSGG